MKKQLYAAAATAALLSTLPQVIQAEEVMGTEPVANMETEMEQVDPNFQAELAALHQKVMELSNLAVRENRKIYYQEQSAKLSQVNGEVQFKKETGKTLEQFKTEVEKDYEEARIGYILSLTPPLVSPEIAERIKVFADEPGRTLTDIQAFGKQQLDKYIAELQAEKVQKELEAHKKEALEKIAQIQDLPQSQKNNFSNQVNAAPTKEEVDKIKAAAENYQQLLKEVEEKKKQANAEIKTKADLEVDERSNYLDRLETATNPSEIESILAEANETSKRNTAIFEKRKSIQEQVDKLPYLTDEHRSDIRNQIEDEKSDSGLDSIYSRARKQNVEDAKAPHLAALQQAKDLLKAVQSLPQLADANLSEAQMKIWAEIEQNAPGFINQFEQLTEERATDATFTHKIIQDVKELAIFAEIEKIARELEQKRQKFPDNEALKAIMKDMFFNPYGTVSQLSHFIQQDIYPKQKQFNDLYDNLTNNQGIDSKITLKTVQSKDQTDKPKEEEPAPVPKVEKQKPGTSTKPKGDVSEKQHHHTGQPAVAEKPTLPKASEGRHFATGAPATATKPTLPLGGLTHSAKPGDKAVKPNTSAKAKGDVPEKQHHHTGQPAVAEKPKWPKASEGHHFATGKPATATKPTLPLGGLTHSAKPGDKAVKPNTSTKPKGDAPERHHHTGQPAVAEKPKWPKASANRHFAMGAPATATKPTLPLGGLTHSAKSVDKKVQADRSMKVNQQSMKSTAVSDKMQLQPVQLKQTQKTEKATLPKTNEATGFTSLLGVALAGLAGIFARNRKK
ncbi:GAG-binding domain-containing protein [Streptococcus sp. ZJ93]|uniref:GAG-binding domain-containing protein n=1 Tax=Streptococcus handemini TaxID=3161188 RepID=UPI0032EC8FAE